MDASTLTNYADLLWTWLALPMLGLTALVLTVRLRAPQVTRLAAGLQALRSGRKGEGVTSPSLATWLSATGSLGAAAAVGVGTAVALGGPAAVVWIGVFGIALAPLRYAEVLLARTDAAGKASGNMAGSLAERLRRAGDAPTRALGLMLAIALALAGFAFVGGVHGHALAELGTAINPGAPLLLLGAAVIGGALAAVGRERGAALGGWLGLVGLLVVLGCALIACAQNPSRAMSSIVQVLADASQGSPVVGAFTGALAAEAARASLSHILPSLASTTGIAGALHADARASTKAQAAAALFDPFAGAVVASMLGLALVSTGAFYETHEGSIVITDTMVVTSAFETVSQRQEQDRRFTGYMRVREGQTRDSGTFFATERGMIQGKRFSYWGHPADVAIHFDEGRAARILRPGERGALDALPPSALAHLEVHGRMLLRGAGLVNAAFAHEAGTSTLSRAALAGVLGLVAAALAAWGFALRRMWPKLRGPASAALGLLPAAGLTLELLLAPAWLPAVGGILGAISVSLAALALLFSAREASRIAR